MQFDSFDDPILTMPQVIRASHADRVTIENWVRYKHVVAALDLPGRARRFSLADLVRIDVTWLLRELFKLPVDMASEVAKFAVDAYAPQAMADATGIIKGHKHPASSAYRWQFSMMRMPDGELRMVREGDVPADLGVDLIVPVGLAASYCFQRLSEMTRPQDFDE